MSQPLTEWKVLPHGRLTRVEDNVLTVVGEVPMPLASIPRRMTVVRLGDVRLVIFNAVALDEEEMRVLEEFGTPAFLIVPNGHHRLDAKIWKNRYPQLTIGLENRPSQSVAWQEGARCRRGDCSPRRSLTERAPALSARAR